MDAARRGRDEARRAWPWALEDDAARTIRSRRPAEDWLRQTTKRRRRLVVVSDDGSSRTIDEPLRAAPAVSPADREPPAGAAAAGTSAGRQPAAPRRPVQVRSGLAAERDRRRPPRSLHERAIATGPDRAMLWAALAGIFVVLVAAASAQGATPSGDRGSSAPHPSAQVTAPHGAGYTNVPRTSSR
jgi:hypothetical protein